MRITKLTVENYKSFLKQTGDWFAGVNMIYGHNNSGKSNLLRFIELIFRPKLQTTSVTVEGNKQGLQQLGEYWDGIIQNEPYIFRGNNTDKPILFEVSVELSDNDLQSGGDFGKQIVTEYHKEGPLVLDIRGIITALNPIDSEMRLDSVSLNKRPVLTTVGGEKYFEEASEESALKSNSVALRSLLGTLSNRVLFLDTDRFLADEPEDKAMGSLTPGSFRNWLFNLSLNPNRYKEFMELLKSMESFHPSGDAQFQHGELSSPFPNFELGFARFDGRLEVMFENAFNRLPLKSFGTGVQQIIYVLAKIFDSTPRILLVEELELNLSPKYQHEFIQHVLLKLIQEKKVIDQLFFTTHSPWLCYRSDFRIIEVSIDKNGESQYKKADKSEIDKFYPAQVLAANADNH